MWILGQLFQIAGFFALVACAVIIAWIALALILAGWKFILAGLLLWGLYLYYSLVK